MSLGSSDQCRGDSWAGGLSSGVRIQPWFVWFLVSCRPLGWSIILDEHETYALGVIRRDSG